MSFVLLTDAQQRKTLAATRSLGKRGVKVLAAERTRFTPTAFSRYCHRHLVSPVPADREAYIHWLRRTLAQYPCDLVVPMDDETMRVVMEHREELEACCRLPLPPAASYRVAADKGLAVRAASAAGLDCPETFLPRSREEVSRLSGNLRYPVVIKPRQSSGSRGIRIVRDRTELTETYAAVHQVYPEPLIQEYIPQGDRYDVCLLFGRNQEVKASFVQKEIRHFPLEMGPSTVQESVWCPALLKQALDLMRRLPWFGVVEIEFMIDPRDGRAKFMEINPRFWNSLQAAIQAGVDFPWLLYRLALGQEVETVSTYQTGIKCRWLLPGDLLHFLTNRDRARMDPPFWSGRKQDVYDDLVSLSDPLPVVGFCLACLRYFPDPGMWKSFLLR